MAAQPTRESVRNARLQEPVAFWLATWFGCGLSRLGPGTVAAVATVPLYLALRGLGPGAVAVAATVVTAVGVWSADRVARATRCKDPQLVVIDEAAGVLITWVAAPPSWQGLAAGLVLFRVLDITKPFPCRACEQARPAGLGIMLDDVCAGLMGAALLWGARALHLL